MCIAHRFTAELKFPYHVYLSVFLNICELFKPYTQLSMSWNWFTLIESVNLLVMTEVCSFLVHWIGEWISESFNPLSFSRSAFEWIVHPWLRFTPLLFSESIQWISSVNRSENFTLIPRTKKKQIQNVNKLWFFFNKWITKEHKIWSIIRNFRRRLIFQSKDLNKSFKRRDSNEPITGKKTLLRMSNCQL